MNRYLMTRVKMLHTFSLSKSISCIIVKPCLILPMSLLERIASMIGSSCSLSPRELTCGMTTCFTMSPRHAASPNDAISKCVGVCSGMVDKKSESACRRDKRSSEVERTTIIFSFLMKLINLTAVFFSTYANDMIYT